jgi:hypothetical protein
VDFIGGSGASYSFLQQDDAETLRAVAAAYVIAVRGEAGWRLLAVGHTDSLAERTWAEPLAKARQITPSAQLFIRLNVRRSLREQDAADLAASLGEDAQDGRPS